MRAARRERYGPPSVIEVVESEVPTPRDDEVLIRVRAATVSRTDCAVLSAAPHLMRLVTGLVAPKQKTLGTDFAGKVEQVGRSVTSFDVGDAIWGFDDRGLRSHAEYLVIAPSEKTAPAPEAIPLKEAPACLEGAFYAYNFLNKVSAGPSSRILLNGATGGIGSALLQLCKDLGARVTAVGNTENLELIESLGADEVIDYRREDFTRSGETFDYVFDAVGKSSFGRCRHLLKPGGVYCSSELGRWIENPVLALVTPALGKRKVVFPRPVDLPGFFTKMSELIEAGRFRPVIDRTYGLEEIGEAYEYVASGQKTGNVLVEP